MNVEQSDGYTSDGTTSAHRFPRLLFSGSLLRKGILTGSSNEKKRGLAFCLRQLDEKPLEIDREGESGVARFSRLFGVEPRTPKDS